MRLLISFFALRLDKKEDLGRPGTGSIEEKINRLFFSKKCGTIFVLSLEGS